MEKFQQWQQTEFAELQRMHPDSRVLKLVKEAGGLCHRNYVVDDEPEDKEFYFYVEFGSHTYEYPIRAFSLDAIDENLADVQRLIDALPSLA